MAIFLIKKVLNSSMSTSRTVAIFPFKLNFNYRTIYLQRILNSRLDTRETQIDSRAFNNGEEFVYKLKAERKKTMYIFSSPPKKN